MNYIVFDLETVVVRNDEMVGHIIEIGAVKVKSDNKNISIIDTFQTYVKLPENEEVSKDTLEFIGAASKDFEESPFLSDAVEIFREWIGQEEYCLCAWSPGELTILTNNWNIKKFDISWFVNFNDIQPLICRAIDPKDPCFGLEKAVTLKLGKQDEKKFHSALYDSHCTALLFIDCYDVIKDNVVTNDVTFEFYVKTIEENKEKNRIPNAVRKMGNGHVNSIFSGMSRRQREKLLKKFY